MLTITRHSVAGTELSDPSLAVNVRLCTGVVS